MQQLLWNYGWNTFSYQIVNPGMCRWYSSDGGAVVGYVPAAGYHIVAGAPICAGERLGAVALAFERMSAVAGKRVCYVGAQDRLADALAERGPVARLLLGAQPMWRLAEWEERIGGNRRVRQDVRRAAAKGVCVQEWESTRAATDPSLRRCLRNWLDGRGLPPMRFLVETDVLAHLQGRRVFVAVLAGRPIAFVIATPIPLRHGWLIEQMIRGQGAPVSTIDLLIDTVARTLAREGADLLTLGLAPLSRASGLHQAEQTLLVRAALVGVQVYGERFYHFAGLDRFKNKFRPHWWEPVYALVPQRRFGIGALYAIAGAFAGKDAAVFVAQALLRAAVRRIRR